MRCKQSSRAQHNVNINLLRVQARAYDNILSSYTGVPLSKGGSYDVAASRENATALALFNAGQPSFLGFAAAQINGIWAAPIGTWRVMSWIFDLVRFLLLCVLCCACCLMHVVLCHKR